MPVNCGVEDCGVMALLTITDVRGLLGARVPRPIEVPCSLWSSSSTDSSLRS